MSFNRGDVVLVRFPHTDLMNYSRRPALVVQDENVHTGFSQKLVAQITSNTSRSGVSRVLVRKDTPAGREMGIRTDSVIVADKIATVVNREIERVIGHCTLSMPDVETALRRILRL